MSVIDLLGAVHKPVLAQRDITEYISRVWPWIGFILLLVCAIIPAEKIGSAPTQRNWVFGRLGGSSTLSQTFVPEQDDLIAIRVLLFANPALAGRDDPVSLHLRYTDERLPDLATVTIPLSALSHQEMTTFWLPPLSFDWQAKGATALLRFDIEAPTLPKNEWVTIIAGPDTYTDGTLLLNGRVYPHADSAFQLVYRQHPLDTVLPISRMAYGKPGVLGWPPLYALLGYMFCLVLVFAGRAWWHVRPAN